MQVQVRLFAILRERAGQSIVLLDLPEGATVNQAAVRLGEQLPALTPMLAKVAFAVNLEYAPATQMLSEGDELAVIPAVSGG